jgi:glycosyltransferase involved in cell wall biosynthesis
LRRSPGTRSTRDSYPLRTANSEPRKTIMRWLSYVYTSYFEAFGLPPLEAMACQTAVVTTDCGGNRDYTKHEKNCLVVAPSDITQLTAGMKQLLLNDDKRQKLATNGFNDAQPWTWQRTAEQVESVKSL